MTQSEYKNLDLRQVKDDLKADAAARRAKAGPPRFRSVAAAAASATAFAELVDHRSSSLRKSLYGLPAVGYLLKLAANLIRLPVRLGQLKQDHAELAHRCALLENEASSLRQAVKQSAEDQAAIRRQLCDLKAAVDATGGNERRALLPQPSKY